MAESRRHGWVLNLDAEFELAHPNHSPPERLLRQIAQYGAGARVLLGPNDVLVEPGVEAPAGLVGRAWCPTPRALSMLRAAGVEPEPHPSAAALRRVNHRRFAFELGGGLPGQRYVEERAAVERLLREEPGPLLLKRPLAFSGRGQLRAYAGKLDEKQWSWVDASLRGDGLIVEPLVTPTLELGLHGFVWPDGRHTVGRICVQTVSDRGVFRGVRLAEPGELGQAEYEALTAKADQVATALVAAGYFGPFGIDAYRYELDGRTAFCALGEINARYSMGFVTGFGRARPD